MSDLGRLNATLAEALAVIRAAETALEEAYAAAARDFGIVEAVAGSDPGPTLGRSLTQLQEAMTSIRAERARLAGGRADIQADLARIGQRKVGVSPGVTSTATSGVAASTRAEGLADADARAAWVRERLTSPDPNIRKPARSGVRWADYQRAVAGPDEIFVTSDSPRAGVWADGLGIEPDTVVAIEAKFINKPDRSMYEGRAHPAMQESLLKDFDREILRYGHVVRCQSNPVGRLRLVVSTAPAGEYLGARARRLLGDDVDLDVRVVPEGNDDDD